MLNYNQYLFESSDFKLSTKKFLNMIDIRQYNIFDTFKLNRDKFNKTVSIDDVYNNRNFENYLNANDLKKSEIISTEDSETFISTDMKYFTLHKNNHTELDIPTFIFIQFNNWVNVKCYTTNSNMVKINKILSNMEIEFVDKDKTYTYSSDNDGYDWKISKIKDKTDKFKKIISDEDVKRLLLDSKIKMNIL